MGRKVAHGHNVIILTHAKIVAAVDHATIGGELTVGAKSDDGSSYISC